MRDKRPVDELSIEELERILAIRKRDARQARLRGYEPRRIAAPAAEPVIENAQTLSTSDSKAASIAAIESPISAPVTSPVLNVSPVRPPAFEDSSPHFEDELDRRAVVMPSGRKRGVVIWNRALLGVEVVAVLGLVYLFASLFSSLQAVTQTTANIQQNYQATLAAQFVPPTATPVIRIAAVVLPGGHVYDSASNTARFNLDEVPAQYRDAYQNQILNVTPAAQPTQSPAAPLAIRIPAINIVSTVVTGDSWNDLQRGVGYHVGSASPGESGNMVLSAHDDVYGELFRYLDQLKPGDKIIVTTQMREYSYTVQAHEIVNPTEIRVMDNTRRDIKQVTLITCYPYQKDNQRYIVYGTLNS